MIPPRIIASPLPHANIPDSLLVPFVFERAAQHPDKIAIMCAASGRRLTYGELQQAIRQVAAGLHARGIRKGDVVGLVSPNIPDFAVVFYAVTVLGAVCSTVNPIATAEEIGAQFADSEAVMLFTIPDLHEKCSAAARLASTVREIVVFGEADGATPYASLFAYGDVPPAVEIDPATDVCALPYSSGTSGIPKGVMLTHRNLVANLVQCEAAGVGISHDDVVIGVLPFFHIYGMVVVMGGALREGATIVSMPRFDLEQFLGAIQTHRVTYMNLVPPIILALAKHPVVGNYDVRSVRTIMSGAAPLSADLADACAARLGCLVRQGYGLTETSPVSHFHPFTGDRVDAGSVGPSVPNTECRLVDADTGADVSPGERGELWIRGPQVMKGYFNKPEATAACMTDDGWFKTGDVAIETDGWYRIVDRVKELIKYKGLQVAPAELEAVLLSNPLIADAAVIPVPDAEAGEIPKAYIVKRGEIDAEQVMAYVAERVSPYKKVRQVEFVEAIPKSPSGKILRRLLRDRERANQSG
ncbi:4-coumarate--CoA ligase family protein [Gemmatimonas sp.]|uniref:4-coumarate--CoA ligase family protein n=1 Tax=Gemmatimonas sp. TaxID=1962908 RepID=UPI0027B9CC71|nr:4-coumarate--CoA ligase family protein [Gemmatimonas sp.]